MKTFLACVALVAVGWFGRGYLTEHPVSVGMGQATIPATTVPVPHLVVQR